MCSIFAGVSQASRTRQGHPAEALQTYGARVLLVDGVWAPVAATLLTLCKSKVHGVDMVFLYVFEIWLQPIYANHTDLDPEMKTAVFRYHLPTLDQTARSPANNPNVCRAGLKAFSGTITSPPSQNVSCASGCFDLRSARSRLLGLERRTAGSAASRCHGPKSLRRCLQEDLQRGTSLRHISGPRFLGQRGGNCTQDGANKAFEFACSSMAVAAALSS